METKTMPAKETPSKPTPASTPEAPAKAPQTNTVPKDIIMPELSPSMTKGTLAKWLVQEGDAVKPGDIIAEVETDKVTVELEAESTGFIGKRMVADGDADIAVGTVIASVLAEPAPNATPKPKPRTKPAPDNIAAGSAPQSVSSAPRPSTSPAPKPAAAQATVEHDIDPDLLISPLAKRILQQSDLDVSALRGSGANGRIMKRDIESALGIESPPPSQHEAAAALATINRELLPSYTSVATTGMRAVIADRLTRSSRDTPVFSMSVDCQIDALLAARAEINTRAQGTYKLSLNDFMLKACAAAMAQVPAANCMWAGNEILTFDRSDIAMAVSIPDGLITPIIKDVTAKGLIQISKEARDLVEKARNGSLRPTQYQGGTFCISNLGMYGIKQFTSIINPPQCGILSIGASERRAIEDETGAARFVTAITVTLTMDHRCVDGATGADFIQAFRYAIEQPAAMLL